MKLEKDLFLMKHRKQKYKPKPNMNSRVVSGFKFRIFPKLFCHLINLRLTVRKKLFPKIRDFVLGEEF